MMGAPGATREPWLRFTVPGNPVPKARPRFAKHAYTTAATMAAEWVIATHAMKALGPVRCVTEPLAVELDFYRDSDRRVDVDNLAKTVLDSLNHFVWADDSQIVRLTVVKGVDSDRPRTEVRVFHSRGRGVSYLRVKNWERFQHYKDRRPPWIKFHVELLDDHELQTLPVDARLMYSLILLVAARTDNNIPSDPEYISRQTALPAKVVAAAVQTLVDKGFLVPSDRKRAASKALARRKQSAKPETEAYTEKKKAHACARGKQRANPRTNLLRLIRGDRHADSEHGAIHPHRPRRRDRRSKALGRRTRTAPSVAR